MSPPDALPLAEKVKRTRVFSGLELHPDDIISGWLGMDIDKIERREETPAHFMGIMMRDLHGDKAIQMV